MKTINNADSPILSKMREARSHDLWKEAVLAEVGRRMDKISDENHVLIIPKSDVPRGFQICEAYENEMEIVILGSPESDDENHDCDALGCSSVSHVIMRISKTKSKPPQPLS